MQTLAPMIGFLWPIYLLGISYLVFLFPSPEYPGLNKDAGGGAFLTPVINIAESGPLSNDGYDAKR
ncbi:MAG: hypothetical protein MZV65_28270 [Chromatiales bacterium]|nr:hypothetical protein [Chromatiales bacterium]